MTFKFGPFEEPLADRYRFEAELGRGGMGTVYRAMDLRLGRPVAIKLLHTALTNDVGVARFQSEIRIAAGLRHAHIVALHDSGEAAGHLYYVMDFAEGETLRARIKREKQMSVDDAIRIVSEVAEGLQYAHDHGVVHRDVKPENIILSHGHACVVDFGLAKAVESVDEDRLTASGLAVGTPHYLSPEQAAAERDVGPKADQYALACVLYEMLAGEPPFTGPTASSIAMKHIATPPEPLRKRRRSVPVYVEAAVQRAMEKVPADRFKSVSDFVAALRAKTRGVEGWLAKAAIACVVVVLFGTLGRALARSETLTPNTIGDGFRKLTGRDLDSNKVVVFPIASSATSLADPGLDEGIRNAFARWVGVNVASNAEVTSAIAATPTVGAARTLAQERAVARSLRAARFVTVQIVPMGVTQEVRIELQDARGIAPSRLVRKTLLAGTTTDSLLARLAYDVLFDGDEAERNADARFGTRHRAAFALYLRGKAAERTWNLSLADSAYSKALRIDPSFPQAMLALAQVRWFAHDVSPEVTRLTDQAIEGRARLAADGRLHAVALRELSSKHWVSACARYDSLLKRDSLDFATLYGIGDCNRLDKAVVEDRRSPSGRSFRRSPGHASSSLIRAFELLPAIDSCCIARISQVLRRTLFLSATKVMVGTGVGADSAQYAAYPQVSGDTIGFIPRRSRDLSIGSPPITHALAVRKQREAFYDIAAHRVSLFPRSADAVEELAEAMELRGDVGIVDTVRRARGLSNQPSQRIRLATTEVWLLVKTAGLDSTQLAQARRLADSLLENARVRTPEDADELSSIAALTGDATRAASYGERGSKLEKLTVPVSQRLLGTARALLIFAAMGGPEDSIRAREHVLELAIANDVVQQEQAYVREALLDRAACLAYPVVRLAHLSVHHGSDDLLINALASHRRHDTVSIRGYLGAIDASRMAMRPADLTIDALYTEAWLLAAIGDSVGALKRLGPTLDALESVPVSRLRDAPLSGAIVLAMVLRAKLATAAGDVEVGHQYAATVRALSDSTYRVGRERHIAVAKMKGS